MLIVRDACRRPTLVLRGHRDWPTAISGAELHQVMLPFLLLQMAIVGHLVAFIGKVLWTHQAAIQELMLVLVLVAIVAVRRLCEALRRVLVAHDVGIRREVLECLVLIIFIVVFIVILIVIEHFIVQSCHRTRAMLEMPLHELLLAHVLLSKRLLHVALLRLLLVVL